jgi:hypothetical protein
MDCRHLERSAKQLGERHVGILYLDVGIGRLKIALDRGQAVLLTLDIKIMNNFNSSDFGSGSSDQSRCQKSAGGETPPASAHLGGMVLHSFMVLGWGSL